MLHIDTTSRDDLVRELSIESVQYFTNLELAKDEWQSYDSPKNGKFIRLGTVIFIGPDISYGLRDLFSNQRTSLSHRDMCYHALQGMGEEIATRIVANMSSDGVFLGGFEGLLDAGYAKIVTAEGGTPNQLILNEKSYDFGRGDEAARERTREIAAAILAPNIEVVSQ